MNSSGTAEPGAKYPMRGTLLICCAVASGSGKNVMHNKTSAVTELLRAENNPSRRLGKADVELSLGGTSMRYSVFLEPYTSRNFKATTMRTFPLDLTMHGPG